MNTKISLFILVVFLVAVSCKGDKDSPLPGFDGITNVDGNGRLIGARDTTDWRIDNKFNEFERNLFDTLKFDQTLLKSDLKGVFSVGPSQASTIDFYPNPVTSLGSLRCFFGKIMNIAIVDKDFTKKVAKRLTCGVITFDFSSFNNGVYRMYYVLQDSTFKIIGLGHGDIQIKR